MNIALYDKTYVVELLIAGGSTQQTIYFPIIQVLDKKLTQSVKTYSIQSVLKSPQNVALANDPLLKSSYLNLYVGSEQRIWNIPLVDLCTNHTSTSTNVVNPFSVELNNLSVIWAKSFVFIADTSKIAVANEVFLMNISYTDLKVAGKE